MKTIKSIIYGLSICWLIFVSVDYLISTVIHGLEDIIYCELNGVALFVTMLRIIITVIRYPVKQLFTRWLKEIDKEFKKRKAHKVKSCKWNNKVA